MPVIYIPKGLYDELVRLGKDPGQFVIAVAEKELERVKAAKPVPGHESE